MTEYQIHIVRWAMVEAMIRYGCKDSEHNKRVTDTLVSATPKQLQAMLGIEHYEFAQDVSAALRLNFFKH